MVCCKVGMSVEQRVGREAAWMDDCSVAPKPQNPLHLKIK